MRLTEFEFSFPSELSPSLFSSALPFMAEYSGLANGVSPTASSFPSLSLNGGDSPVPLPEHPPLSHTHHQQSGTPLPQHAARAQPIDLQQPPSRPHLSTRPSKRLFGEDERSALDAFFSETLGESSTSAGPSTSYGNGEGRPEQAEGSASKRRRSSAARLPKKPSSPLQSTSRRIEEEAVHTSPENYEDMDADLTYTAVKQEDDADYIAMSRSAPARASRPKAALSSKKANDDPVQQPRASTAASKRSNHIASEQRRRTTIKDNYKALVDLLLAGEAISGIYLQNSAPDEEEEEGTTGKGKKGKPKGRGRGRKGQDGAGATKSVVLERAADYLRWLERGNDALEAEIERMKAH